MIGLCKWDEQISNLLVKVAVAIYIAMQGMQTQSPQKRTPWYVK